MIEPHAACTLNDGFQNQCCQFLMMFFYNIQQFQCIIRIPIAIEP